MLDLGAVVLAVLAGAKENQMAFASNQHQTDKTGKLILAGSKRILQ